MKHSKYTHKKSGDIASYLNDDQYKVRHTYRPIEGSEYTLPAYLVEQSNDWEEIKEKEWEITKFEDINLPGYFYNSNHNGTYGKGSFTLDDCLNKWRNKIYSVKRLSDNVEFSVGDKIHQGRIESFELIDHRIKIYFKPAPNSSVFVIGIEHLKVLKQPLFTTSDGVEIFENTDFWYTDRIIKSDSIVSKSNSRNGKPNELRIVNFSTPELATDYLIARKECLSLMDVETIIGSLEDMDDDFKQFIKQKLNL